MHKFNYFSGFSLKNESSIFSENFKPSPYNIVGFSLGAINALEYTLTTTLRVDKLTLLSPAFFLGCDKKFIRTQLIYFKKDRNSYIKNFLQNSAYPTKRDLTQFLDAGNMEELRILLEYQWSKEKLEKLIQKEIKIEVYLGSCDKIVDTKKAYDYFKDYATVYYLKDKGHILCKQ